MQGKQAWPAALAAVLVIAIGSVSAAAGAAPARGRHHRAARTLQAVRREQALVLRGIAGKRLETWRWERLMGRRRTRSGASERRIASLAYRQWVLRLWTRRAARARRLALHPPRLHDWLCIHHFEGPWNDPGAPYYGGLQMDLEFQQTYAPDLLRRKGTADHWTPLEQIWVAERAYESGRGFYPWPNTARYCGLL